MNITAVIINYQTPELLEIAVTSFKKFYPQIQLLILDNGSTDSSVQLIEKLCEELPSTSSVNLKQNIFHGPAMDLVCRKHIDSEFVFFLDSDTETLRGGFFERMLPLLDSKKVYGAGELVTVNKRGFKSKTGFTILQTPYMLFKTEIYRTLPPFVHHGQPTLFNFREALKQGYQLREFKITEFINHKWRGTADKFGYGLGWRGKVDYILNKIGI